MIMLAPGTYRLAGRSKGETAGRRGLKWRLACAGETSVVLGESAMAIGVAAIGVLLAKQHRLVGPSDLSRVGIAFFNLNAVIAVLYFLNVLAAVLAGAHWS